MIQSAVNDGVEYVEGTVTKLLFDEQGDCFGVELNGGQKLEASNVILSMGAGIAKLFADSAPDRSDIQVEDRIIGAAVVTGIVKLNPAQIEEYKDMPLFIHRVGGVSGSLKFRLCTIHADRIFRGSIPTDAGKCHEVLS